MAEMSEETAATSTPSLIVVNDGGNNEIDFRLWQSSNAYAPIVVRLEEGRMLMLVRLEQESNAFSSIIVTDAGNDMDVRLRHL